MDKRTRTEGKRKPYEQAECVFDGAYLLFAAGAGLWFLFHRGSHPVLGLYGTMTLLLGGGDAFHLIPRMAAIGSGNWGRWKNALGAGKLVTSVTMTGMYVLLFFVWRGLYPEVPLSGLTFLALCASAVLRVLVCLHPGNRWLQGDGSMGFAVMRNLPFALMGVILISLFFQTASLYADGFAHMWLAILLSFAFYMPVALWSGKIPALGALMLPKTLMYVWMIAMGFSLLG